MKSVKGFLAGVVIVFSILVWVLWSPGVNLVFLDVGQGDGVFFRSPSGHKILIDGGPDASVLNELGRVLHFFEREFDLLVVTHPNADHFRGARQVLEKYRVKSMLVPDVPWDGVEYAELLRVAGERGVRVIFARGQSFALGEGWFLDVLYPRGGLSRLRRVNDASVVTRLRRGGSDFVALLTGDVEVAGWERIRASGVALRAGILKVSHHGSVNGTPAWLVGRVQPRESVISVGKNKYGHPRGEVLDILSGGRVPTRGTRTLSIRTRRTDVEGMVGYKF